MIKEATRFLSKNSFDKLLTLWWVFLGFQELEKGKEKDKQQGNEGDEGTPAWFVFSFSLYFEGGTDAEHVHAYEHVAPVPILLPRWILIFGCPAFWSCRHLTYLVKNI